MMILASRRKSYQGLVRELLDFVDDVLDEPGSRKEVEHIHTIPEAALSGQLRGL